MLNMFCVWSKLQWFIFTDFSFTNWLQEMNVTLDNLRDNAKSLLLQQLGVDQYLLETPCDVASDRYSPSEHGWKNGKLQLCGENKREKNVWNSDWKLKLTDFIFNRVSIGLGDFTPHYIGQCEMWTVLKLYKDRLLCEFQSIESQASFLSTLWQM